MTAKRSVHGALDLAVAASEINGHGIAVLLHAQADPDGFILGLAEGENAVAIAEILKGVLAVVETLKLGANHPLGVVLHAGHHAEDDIGAVLVGKLLDTDGTAEIGGKLGGEVATALLGGAYIGEDDGVDVVVKEALGV